MNRCTIAGCARAYRCSGYCAVHYDRARRGRSLADPPPPAKLSACSVDGCAASVVARGWCKVHYYRWKKMGRTELATRSVTYATAHRRVITARGPASGHRCVDCGGQAQEWSYNHADPNESVDRRGRPYSYDLNNYDPRCRGCHRLKDAPEKITEEMTA